VCVCERERGRRGNVGKKCVLELVIVGWKKVMSASVLLECVLFPVFFHYVEI